MIHALITAIICLPIFIAKLFFPIPSLIFLYPAFWYMGREYTQAEYRYIEQYCNRKRANMPWWAPLTSKAWTTKGMLDWILPSIVSIGFYLVNYYFVLMK